MDKKVFKSEIIDDLGLRRLPPLQLLVNGTHLFSLYLCLIFCYRLSEQPVFLPHNVCSGIFRMHPSRTSGSPVVYSSTSDVSGTYLAVGPGFRYMLPAIRRSWVRSSVKLCPNSGMSFNNAHG